MQRLPTRFALLAFAAVAASFSLAYKTLADEYTTRVLCGRWISGQAPASFYIIDRYANGTFALKRYFTSASSKEVRVALLWGAWKIEGRKYSLREQGTTDVVFTNPSSTSYTIAQLSPVEFAYYVPEGLWTEKPYPQKGSLTKVKPLYRTTTIQSRSAQQETLHSNEVVMEFKPVQFNQSNRPPDWVLNSDP
jgi:hypothetical protein